jgi:hypothetical protein
VTFAIGDVELPGVSKVVEEAGELLQVVGKLMAVHGSPEGWDGTDLRERFVLELADLAAAIHFVVKRALTVEESELLVVRFRAKFALFEQWHVEQGVSK